MHAIHNDLLLADWEKVKKEFLETPAPPFAAEKQRAGMMEVVNAVLREYKQNKMSKEGNPQNIDEYKP